MTYSAHDISSIQQSESSTKGDGGGCRTASEPSYDSCHVLTSSCCPRDDVLCDSSKRTLHYNMIKEHADGPDVWKYYENIGLIGVGSISNILKVKRRTNKKKKKTEVFLCRKICWPDDTSDSNNIQYYGLKMININLVNETFLLEMKNEIEMFRSMDHPNILKAYEVFYRANHISIIMELCTGGDLYTRNPYTEKESAEIMKQLLSAVAYMHQNSIIHRDLKFENVMFSSKDPNASIKVIDFGLSKKYLDPSINITDYVGTVYTMAPEVINRVPYSYKADMFSVGVISYMLLSGCKPFWAKTRKEIAEKVKNCDYSLSNRYWHSISEEAKDFVSKLIEKDPDRRLSAKDAKDHLWLKQNHIDPSNGSHLVHSEHIEKSLIHFADSGEFKKLVLNVLAHQVSAEDIKCLETIFKSYDKDNNGYITNDAFKDALSQLSNLSDESKENMFQSLDYNRNGNIMYSEFIAATLESQIQIEESNMRAAFDRIDCDNTGFISKKNLCCLLGDVCNDEFVDGIIREADTNNDGVISFNEFMDAFRKKKRSDLKDFM